MIASRCCSRCGEEKLLSAFYKDARRGRVEAQCKSCRLADQKTKRTANPEKSRAAIASWKARNPERQKAGIAAWQARNPEKMLAASRAWRARNPEKQQEFTSAWRQKNLAKVSKTKAVWRASNKERSKAVNAEWRAANPELVRLHVTNRRARLMASYGKLSRGIVERLLTLQRGRCVCCRNDLGETYHLDHIMPLARGGLNTDKNVQLLCPSCNHRKHAKHPIDYMQEMGFLL